MARNTEGSHGTHAALAHVTHSEILTYLKDKGYVCVDQIAEDLGIPDSKLSGHLTVTKTAGLLVSRQPVHRRGPHRVPISAVDGLGSVDRVPVFRHSSRGRGAWWSPAFILENRVNIIARHGLAGATSQHRGEDEESLVVETNDPRPAIVYGITPLPAGPPPPPSSSDRSSVSPRRAGAWSPIRTGGSGRGHAATGRP